jgi:hypothetical protein
MVLDGFLKRLRRRSLTGGRGVPARNSDGEAPFLHIESLEPRILLSAHPFGLNVPHDNIAFHPDLSGVRDPAAIHEVIIQQTVSRAGAIATSSNSLPSPVTTSATTAPALSIVKISPDTGSSATDGVTNIGTVAITGTIDAADAGSKVSVFRGTTLLGTATPDGLGNWTLSGAKLAAGVNSLIARATNAAGPAVRRPSSQPSIRRSQRSRPSWRTTRGRAWPTRSRMTRVSKALRQIMSELALLVGFGTNPTSYVDVTDTVQPGGSFYVSAARLAAIHGGSLPDGSYTVGVQVVDLAGNKSKVVTTTFTLDATPPALSIKISPDTGTSASDGVTNVATVTVSGTIDLADVKRTVSLYNGTTLLVTLTPNSRTGNWSLAKVVLAQGANNLTARAADVAGNTGIASLGAILNTTPPVVSASLANDNGASATDGLSNDASITGKVTDIVAIASLRAGFGANPANFVSVLDALNPDGTFYLSAARLAAINGGTLPDGSYKLSIQAADIAGNTSAVSSVSFTLDTVAPVLTIGKISPDTGTSASDGITNVATVTVSGTIDAADANLTISVYNGTTLVGTTTANASGNWSLAGVTLTQDANGLTAQATDLAGNTDTSPAFTATLDTQAPTVTGQTPTSATAASPVTIDVFFSEPVVGIDASDLVLTGSATATAVVQTPTSFDGGSLWRFTVAGLTDGSVNVQLGSTPGKITDLAGNPLANQNWSFTVDRTPPSVVAITPRYIAVPPPNVNIDVQFSEHVNGIAAQDLILGDTGAATATVGTPVDLGNNTWRFPVTGLQSGAVSAALGPSPGSITDDAGNALGTINWRFTADPNAAALTGPQSQILSVANNSIKLFPLSAYKFDVANPNVNAGQLDASYVNTADGGALLFTAGQELAQTFTVQTTGTLTAVGVNVAKDPYFAPSDPLIVEVRPLVQVTKWYQNNYGQWYPYYVTVPSDTVFASASLQATSISTSKSFVYVNIPAPFSVYAGEQLAIVLRGSNSPTQFYYWAGDMDFSYYGEPAGTYAGGQGYWKGPNWQVPYLWDTEDVYGPFGSIEGSYTVYSGGNVDFGFQTFVSTGAAATVANDGGAVTDPTTVSHDFVVRYISPNTTISASSLDNSDISVTDPNGQVHPATLVATTPSTDSSTIDATYRTSLVSNGALNEITNGANANSFIGQLSADGRYLAFASGASNLVPGDTNNAEDVFVEDVQSGAVTMVSSGGNDVSFDPSISADGRYVAFASYATNLVAGDTNGQPDVFVKDMQTGTLTDITLGANGFSLAPTISADGHHVAFFSVASNLVPGHSGDYFVKDLQTGALTDVAPGLIEKPALSADGQYIAFGSTASNLVPGDTNGKEDVFVKDLSTGNITMVSAGGNGASQNPSISADGQHVAFVSAASNLVPGDTNNANDIFVRDIQTVGNLQTGSLTWVSAGGNAGSASPSISSDGRYVAFSSFASNLLSGDTNGNSDVFLKDLQTGRLTMVSSGGSDNSLGSSVSADGHAVAFTVGTPGQVPGLGTQQNVWIWDQAPAPGTYTVSLNPNQVFDANGASVYAGIIGSFKVDYLPPRLISFTADAVTTSSLLNVVATFSEPVTGVDASDLVLSGNAAQAARVSSAVDIGNNAWRFGIDGLTPGMGTVTFRPSGTGIANLAGIAMANFTSPVSTSFTMDPGRILYAGNGLTITSSASGSLGVQVSGAGDFNGDGIADYLVTAPDTNVGSGTENGSVYVIFGSKSPQSVDLDTFDTLIQHGGGVRIDGVTNSQLGASAAAAGDVDGDGLSDIVIGAPFTNAGQPGRAYVIYGSKTAQEINLANANWATPPNPPSWRHPPTRSRARRIAA